VLFLGLNPFFLVLVLLWGGPAIVERFRNDQSDYYQSVPVPARLAMGAAWIFLAGYLGYALIQTVSLMGITIG